MLAVEPLVEEIAMLTVEPPFEEIAMLAVEPPVEEIAMLVVEHPAKRSGCPLEPHATTVHSPLLKFREEVECISLLDAA